MFVAIEDGKVVGISEFPIEGDGVVETSEEVSIGDVYSNGTFSKGFDISRINEIKMELEALDSYVPRSVEGLAESGQVTLDEYNRVRMDKKKTLRIELAILEQ